MFSLILLFHPPVLFTGEMKWAEIKVREIWVLDIRKKTYVVKNLWWKCRIGVLRN